jgi:hypothetical protein
MTAVPVVTWLFVALVVVVVYRRVGLVSPTSADPAGLLPFALGVIRIVAVVLLPAALFLRHPDAWSRLRPLAAGLVLMAVAQLLREAAPIIGDVLASPTPDANTSMILTPAYLVGRLGSVVGLLAIGYTWIGISDARRYEDPPSTRALLVVVVVAAVAVTVAGAAGLVREGLFDNDAVVAAANGVALLVSAATMLAWLPVASVLIAGARVREPGVGTWWVAAAGVVLGLIATSGPVWVLDALGAAAGDTYALTSRLASVAATTGAVLLLAAFALGLPADEPPQFAATEP